MRDTERVKQSIAHKVHRRGALESAAESLARVCRQRAATHPQVRDPLVPVTYPSVAVSPTRTHTHPHTSNTQHPTHAHLHTSRSPVRLPQEADVAPSQKSGEDDEIASPEVSPGKGAGAVTWLSTGFPGEADKAAFMVRHIHKSYENLGTATSVHNSTVMDGRPPNIASPSRKAMWYGLRTSLRGDANAAASPESLLYHRPTSDDSCSDTDVDTVVTTGGMSPRAAAAAAATAAVAFAGAGAGAGAAPLDGVLSAMTAIPRGRGSVTELIAAHDSQKPAANAPKAGTTLWNMLAGVVGFCADNTMPFTTSSSNDNAPKPKSSAELIAAWHASPDGQFARMCKDRLSVMCARSKEDLDGLVTSMIEWVPCFARVTAFVLCHRLTAACVQVR